MKSLFQVSLAAITLFMSSTNTVSAQEEKTTELVLIELNSVQGQQLLTESDLKGDFFDLIRYFNTQKNLAYCGVASSAMVLNALPVPKPHGGDLGDYPYFTQENFFSPAARTVKSPDKVAQEGMSLAELTDLLNTHPKVKAEKIYASATTLETFKKRVCDQLNSPKSYILINYMRKSLGQKSGGHISPVVAYHKEKDAFLILDVSQYKYPPVWVPTKTLWAAMEAKDGDTLSRGYVIVGTTGD